MIQCAFFVLLLKFEFLSRDFFFAGDFFFIILF
jgi:hypothetical protein